LALSAAALSAESADGAKPRYFAASIRRHCPHFLVRISLGGFMRWPDGRYIQASIFFSRWLLAPFLLGLLLCLFVLMYRFFGDLFLLIVQTPMTNWHDVVTSVLNLVDLALTANLILIVIFSSYENFIRRIDASDHPDWPEGLTQVDFGALKQKLLGSVVGIAAVDALAWYFDLEKEPDTSKLIWVMGFPLVFALVMLILAAADWLSDNRKGSPHNIGHK
jgi:uncharacterized protein (TIGR00645 family)